MIEEETEGSLLVQRQPELRSETLSQKTKANKKFINTNRVLQRNSFQKAFNKMNGIVPYIYIYVNICI